MASSMAAEVGQKAFTLAGLRAASCQTQGLLRLPPSLQSAISAFIGGAYLISQSPMLNWHFFGNLANNSSEVFKID